MKDSAEIFASFTLSRIRRETERDPLSDEQYKIARACLVAQDGSRGHSIDLRITLPLLFVRYYVVLMSGIDNRSSEQRRLKGKRVSAEIFASLMLERLHEALSEHPLSVVQESGITRALIAQNRSQRHAIDLRGSLPLIFKRFYFVLFAGRDRRAKTLQTERHRWSITLKGIIQGKNGTELALLFSPFILGALYIVYLFKSAMGINILDDMHLADVIKLILNE